MACFDNSDERWMLIRRMREAGAEVVLTESESKRYLLDMHDEREEYTCLAT
jgi:hypothetical protein